MPELGPALRLRSFLRLMWRYGGVLDRRRGLPRLNAHRSHPPTVGLELEMAAALGGPWTSTSITASAGTNFSGTFPSSLASTVGRYLYGLERLWV